MNEWSYLISGLVLLTIWLVIFLARKDLRREMLIMSTLIALIGFTEMLAYGEYWEPILKLRLFNLNLGFESFLFTFTTGGIATVIYELIFNKHFIKNREKINPVALLIVGATTIFILSLKLIIDVPMMLSFLIGAPVAVIAILIIRPDLSIEILFSALFFTILYFILLRTNLLFANVIDDWWILEGFWKYRVLDLPIGELLWAFGWGASFGGLYEFLFQKKLK